MPSGSLLFSEILELFLLFGRDHATMSAFSMLESWIRFRRCPRDAEAECLGAARRWLCGLVISGAEAGMNAFWVDFEEIISEGIASRSAGVGGEGRARVHMAVMDGDSMSSVGDAESVGDRVIEVVPSKVGMLHTGAED